MKLYANDLSPYGNRVKIAIYAKDLPIEIAAPPEGGTKSPEYLAINPMGRVPALQLDDGTSIPESDTIMEYLADRFPEKGLRPDTPELKARARLLSRIADLYVIGVGTKLFAQMNPETRDAAAVDAGFEELGKGIGHLNTYLGDSRYAVSDTLTAADCTLAPILLFTDVFGQMFGRAAPSADHPKVAAYWARIQTEPAVAKTLVEMRTAMKAVLGV